MRGLDYDCSAIPEIYERARAMREADIARWTDAVASHAAGVPVDRILDAGCGTGRFSGALAARLGAPVLGVDPSAKMLAAAARSPGVSYMRGRCEALPLAGESVGLVFMSLVWHHLTDTGAAAREIARVLRPGGIFCLRAATAEGSDACLYLRFFPTAKRILRPTLPPASGPREIIDAGLVLCAQETIALAGDDRLEQYVQRVASRAYSELARIPDADFQAGMTELTRYAAEHRDAPAPVEPLELFTYRKPTRAR